MGFLQADEGQVIVAHTDITRARESELRRVRDKVTMVFSIRRIVRLAHRGGKHPILPGIA